MATQFDVLRLPQELQDLVWSYVTCRSTQLALARTSAFFQDIAERKIYNTILLKRLGDQESARLQTSELASALHRRSTRAQYIKRLHVNKPTCSTEDEWRDLPDILDRIAHVEELILEAAACYSFDGNGRRHWVNFQAQANNLFRDASIFHDTLLSMPFSRLRYLELYFVDEEAPLLSFDAYTYLFFIEHLETLKLSRLYLDSQQRWNKHVRRIEGRGTALRTLRLEQCDIFPGSLTMLLRLPKALENLTIIECQDYISSRIVYGAVPYDDLEAALRPQVESLTRLEIELRPVSLAPIEECLDLSFLSCLETLSIDRFTLTAIGADNIQHRLPRSLQHITLLSAFHFTSLRHYSRDRKPFFDIARQIVRASSPFPDLQSLYLIFNSHAPLPNILSPMVEGEEPPPPTLQVQLSTLNAAQLGREAQKLAIHFKVCSMSSHSGWIPPFLYGEPQPQLEVEYDSRASQDSSEKIDLKDLAEEIAGFEVRSWDL